MQSLAELANGSQRMMSAMPQPQAPMPQTLAGVANSPPQSGASGNAEQVKSMMTMLAQSPTPETAQQIVQIMQGSGHQDAAKVADIIMQFANDPQKLQELAQKILESI